MFVENVTVSRQSWAMEATQLWRPLDGARQRQNARTDFAPKIHPVQQLLVER
jgi:hypothetical protein